MHILQSITRHAYNNIEPFQNSIFKGIDLNQVQSEIVSKDVSSSLQAARNRISKGMNPGLQATKNRVSKDANSCQSKQERI